MGIVAGVLLILISIVHIIYGEKKQIPSLREITQNSVIIGSTRIMVSQGGFILLAVGIIQVLNAIKIIELEGVARYFPVSIVIINFCVSLIIAVIAHREIFTITIPQFLIFAIIIVLQLLSI